MEPVWFAFVAVMIIAYVVLDGFDLGAGVLHLLIARTEEERVTVIRTIGSVWDGNEVWLIAGVERCVSPFHCSMPPASAASICRST